MNIRLLLSIAFIAILFSCNSTKKVELTKNESAADASSSFEGKIFYDFLVKDKTGEMPGDMAEMMFGTKQTYTAKKGMYKSEFNGQMGMTQIYPGGDSLFMQMAGIDGLLWNDVNLNSDELKSFDIEKNAAEIAGKSCDVITIKSKDGTSQFYYNEAYAVNPKDFSKHEFAFWKFYVEKAKALPLKIVMDTDDIYLEATATEVKAMKIDDSEFALPDLKRVKNPEP